MLKKPKKEYNKILVKDSDYNYVMDDIYENNRKITVILCSICIAIFSILITLGFLDLGVEFKDIPVFSIALLYAAVILILLKICRKKAMLLLCRPHIGPWEQ